MRPTPYANRPSTVRRITDVPCRHFLLALVCVLALLLSPAAAWAKLQVRSAILLNLTTGRVLYEQNADMRIPPASLTKVLAMFIAMDQVRAGKLSLKTNVRISRAAATTGGSRMRLRTGQRVPLEKLLTGMAVASGNDASMAVAQRISTSSRSFVRIMNEKARQLGMKNSVFKTPHGLPAAGQITTARDMLTLARSYILTHPSAMRFHNTRVMHHNGFTIRNTNGLLGNVRGVDGLKTGWIAASGYNLIFTGKRGNTRLLGVVMGGTTKQARDRDARKLLEAGFASPSNAAKVKQRIDGRRRR